MINPVEKTRKNRKILMTESFWEYRKFPSWKEDKGLTIMTIINITLFLSAFGLIAYFFRKLPPEIPLYFAKIGAEALAKKQDLYFLPLGFALFTLLNFYLAHIFYRKEKLLSQMLIFASLFLNVMLIFIILKLTYIMGLIL